ncbi:hypothetical protein HDR67_02770 [bacterium]|nr:hypothetical protein [bacterium]
MAWSQKKLLARLIQYLENKKIPFEMDEDKLIVKMDLFFKNCGFMLYPYVKIEEGVCSINVNVSKPSKGFSLETLNHLNQTSKFFKCFLTEDNLITLEYRFIINEIDSAIFDEIIDSLYMLEDDLDTL